MGAVGATDTVFAVVSPGEVVEVSLLTGAGLETVAPFQHYGGLERLRDN